MPDAPLARGAATVRCDWFVLCEKASIDKQDGRVTLTKIFRVLNADAWPLEVGRFQFAARLEGPAGEELRLMFRVWRPDGELFRQLPPFTVTVHDHGAALAGAQIESARLPMEGLYRVELLLEGQPVATTTLTVLGPAQGGRPS